MRIQQAELRLKRKYERLEELKAIAESPPAFRYGCIGSSTRRTDRRENAIIHYSEYKKQFEHDMQIYFSWREEMRKQILELKKPLHTELLFKRFFEYKTFPQIAKEVGYSSSHTQRETAKALKEFEKLRNT